MPSAFRLAGTSNRGPKRGSIVTKETTLTSSRTGAPAVVTPSSYRGVKPWQGGFYLTSVGLSDLDNILGGGHPIGTAILLEEDRWTRDLALSLVKYWCAEAVSQGQHLVAPVASTNVGDVDLGSIHPLADVASPIKAELLELLSALPRNLHWDKWKKRSESEGTGIISGSSTIDSIGKHMDQNALREIFEEGEDEEEEDISATDKFGDEGLEIAWQYKLSVQQERL